MEEFLERSEKSEGGPTRALQMLASGRSHKEIKCSINSNKTTRADLEVADTSVKIYIHDLVLVWPCNSTLR